MSDTDDSIETTEQALTELETYSGRSVVTAETAFDLLRHFPDLFDGDPYELQTWLAENSTSVHDLRIITAEPAWTPAIAIDELSAVLVERAGGEPASSSYLGSGTGADDMHDRNMKKLYDLLADEEDTDE